ncbi:lysosomal acid glucosylceramidase [Parasteatoda tepidariorum]|uniref:lysosomal acid glucosylceramidase n=1 Tax=Parasteatoda tepidariorum TaxID=114398 RepID=UPI001C71B911|nr:lysosomal acid glucosylceramidase [Parasteatoda tepidariorum]
MMSIFYLAIFIFCFVEGFGNPCKPHSFGSEKIVCVCDESYCDDLVLLSNYSGAALYESNKNGARFESSILNFSSTKPSGVSLYTVNSSVMYQFILGFGGAFTDAAGINIASLSPKLQKSLLSSYFSKNGLQYNMGRIPIASCDFSTHPYSYADVKDDFKLEHFQLAKEDLLYKIPYIQSANALSKNQLLLFGSPWSAPAWMKTNGAMNGKGELIGEPGGQYYQTWADYFVRFLKAYEENNVTFWGLTLQNEPTDGCLTDFAFQSMCFPPDKQRDFLKLNLGPTLQKAGFGPNNLKLMIMDDARGLLPRWADIIMKDKEAAQFVSGVAFHWYYEDLMPHRILDITHGKHPSLFFLATEACTAYEPWVFPKVDLGNWERAEQYAHDIIQDLLNWSIGWIDWNLALDMEGGPNWVKNFVDAAIIVNSKSKEFYKQPMYYILGHFSKSLPRGSYRIALDVSKPVENLEIAAFRTPEDKTVVIAVNRQNETLKFALEDNSKGYLNVKIRAHTIQTYIW